jgi:hypothetical protein
MLAPPSKPTGVWASDGVFTDRVAISWTAVNGATSYEVFRDGGLLTTVTSTSHNDTSAAIGTVYSYQVKACNSAGCSALSPADHGHRAASPQEEVFPPDGAVPEGWEKTPGATAGWAVGSDDAFEGTLSLKSSDINDNESAAIEFTTTSPAGVLTFARKVSSESGYDYLSFYIDGVRQERWSGEQAWAVLSYPITAGVHTLKWEYAKDNIVSRGSDAAWIDLVKLPLTRARMDFDGDGRSDLPWRQQSTGENALWLMNGAAVQSNPLITPVPDPNWQIVGTGDFDGDGKADLAWRHGVTGDNAIWLMDGTDVKTGPLITAVPDLAWTLVGTGDFDADGKSDLLWRHAVTGDNAIWLMDGTDVKTGPLITAVPDLAWTLVGTGDFDGDGKSDLLWRHAVTGDNAIWLMDGTGVKTGPLITAVPDLGWALVGTGDFDGDGKSDLLWRHAVTGDNALWLMDGTDVKTGSFITTVPDIAWHIVAVGDYDGDGKSDLAWRHAGVGANALWLMDGVGVKTGSLIPWVPEPAWAIVQ